jgi:beta-lactamase class A
MENKQNRPTHYVYNSYYRGVNSNPHQPTPKRKRSKKGFLFTALFLLILTGIVGWFNIIQPRLKVYSHKLAIVTTKPESDNQPIDSAQQANLDNMKATINKVINNNPDINLQIAITNINNGDEYNFGQTSPMTAGSVSKIIVATDFLKEVEDGSQSMDETLDDGNTASVDLNSMIVQSSDSAWQAFIDQLTQNQIQKYATSIGVTTFNFNDNSLTARDTSDVLASLYDGSLLNISDTQLILSYLKSANYKQFILPAVPNTDTVYHKIGLYSDNVNDATIITNDNQTISLVIFTNGNGVYNWDQRAQLMQEITKAVLDYYNLN